MVDSFFERALHHIDRSEPATASISELSNSFGDFLAPPNGAENEIEHNLDAFIDPDPDILDEPQIDEEYVSRTLAEVIGGKRHYAARHVRRTIY